MRRAVSGLLLALGLLSGCGGGGTASATGAPEGNGTSMAQETGNEAAEEATAYVPPSAPTAKKSASSQTTETEETDESGETYAPPTVPFSR